MIKERDKRLDNARGIAVLMVVFAHIEITPPIYSRFFSYIMIPLFFFLGGYFLNIKGTNKKEKIIFFIKNRTCRLLITYAALAIAFTFLNVEDLKEVFKNFKHIFLLAEQSIQGIMMGNILWFIPCLVVGELYIAVMLCFFRENNKVLLIISSIAMIIGFCIAKENQALAWGIDTALIMQFFIMLGYLFKKEHLLDRKSEEKFYFVLILFLIYIVMVFGVGSLITSEQIDVRQNIYGIKTYSVITALLGIILVLATVKKIKFPRLVTFMGTNSLLYFAFEPHGSSLVNKVLNSLQKYIDLSLLDNPYIRSVIIAIGGCFLMIIPCIIINKYFPILNGRIYLNRDKRREDDKTSI